MLTPEEYKAKIEAQRRGTSNGLSQPAPITTPLPPSPVPASEHTGISTPSDRGTDLHEGAAKHDALSIRSDNPESAKDSNTEVSTGLLDARNSEDSNNNSIAEQAVIDPAEAYCEECNKSVEDCDCAPIEDDDELAILASLGIDKAKAETFKAKEAEDKTATAKDLESIVGSEDIEANTLSIAEIVAREYATNPDDLKVYFNVFNQTTEKVKDLLPDQLEQKILHLERAIGAIKAMQQACARLATDKKSKETAKEKAERKEREKGYRVPKRRGSDEVDATGALKTKEIGKLSKRDKLIKDLMLAGISKQKAEDMADGKVG